MANYPASLPSATPADHDEVLGELIAVATELGLDPSGAAATVLARIVAAEAATTAAQSTANAAGALAATKADDAATTTALGLKAPLASPAFTGTPTGITKSHVGLGNVDNTADTAKPVSTAQATAIGLKADTTALTAHTGDTANPHAVTKAQVGLGSVDNTADTAKPVSVAQQAALDGKAATAHNHAAGDTTSGTFAIARIPTGQTGTTVPLGNDARFTDARTPTAHKTSHATGGPDVLTPGDIGAIAASILTTKGDLLARDVSGLARVPVGSNGQILVADSADAEGFKWAAAIGRTTPFLYAVNDYALLSRQSGTGFVAASPSSSAANTNGKALYMPFTWDRDYDISELAIHCVALNAGVGAVVRLGIHASTAAGKPGVVVVDAGTASITSVGLKSCSFTSMLLPAGMYFAVLVAQALDTAGVNPSFSTTQNSTQAAPETAPAASNSPFGKWMSSGSVSGALADNPGVALNRGATANVPHIWLKISGVYA